MNARDVVLVTGATSGLGKEVVRALAAAGANVLLHGRDRRRGEATVDELCSAADNDALAFYRADFASLADVHRLAAHVLAERKRLTVLVNNAGVGRGAPSTARMLSADGYELRLAVNYLAPVLLTRLLLPLLAASAPARVVNIASRSQTAIDFDDLMLDHGYDGARAYSRSKLALVMFSFDLAVELRETGVTVNCLHPASRMPTNMTAEAEIQPVSPLAHGLAATLQFISGGDVAGVTGRYYDGLCEARAHSQAYDADARRRLRALTDDLLGLRHRAA